MQARVLPLTSQVVAGHEDSVCRVTKDRPSAVSVDNVLQLRLNPTLNSSLIGARGSLRVRIKDGTVSLIVAGQEYPSISANCDHNALLFQVDGANFTPLGHPIRCSMASEPADPEPSPKRQKRTDRASEAPIIDDTEQFLIDKFGAHQLRDMRVAFWSENRTLQNASISSVCQQGLTIEQVATLYFIPPTRIQEVLPQEASSGERNSVDSPPVNEGFPPNFRGMQFALARLLDFDESGVSCALEEEANIKTSADLTFLHKVFKDHRERLLDLRNCLEDFQQQLTATQTWFDNEPLTSAPARAFLQLRGSACEARWKSLCAIYKSLNSQMHLLSVKVQHHQHLKACGF